MPNAPASPVSMLPSPSTGVIVTGGASGIGRATALALAEARRSVAVWDLDGQSCAEVAEACLAVGATRAIGTAVDVTSIAQIHAGRALASSALGTIGGLVHAAGVARGGPVEGFDDEQWDAIVNVNLRAFGHLVRELLPALRSSGEGAAIVAISSVEGWIGHKNLAVYAASKAGLLGLVRSFAHGLARDGIRVNAVCPGAIETPMLEPLLGMPGYRENLQKRIPLRRLGRPEEIGRVIRFLLSADASYMTGQDIVVDGGMLAVG